MCFRWVRFIVQHWMNHKSKANDSDLSCLSVVTPSGGFHVKGIFAGWIFAWVRARNRTKCMCVMFVIFG